MTVIDPTPRRWADLPWDIADKRTKLLRSLSYGEKTIALLFEGQIGTGKTKCAQLLASALTCRGPIKPLGDPCGTCATCRISTTSRRWYDNGVFDIDCTQYAPKEIAERIDEALRYNPCFPTTRFHGAIVLLDEAQVGGTKLSERLLRIVEDESPNVYIFMTSDSSKLNAALRQRCRRVEFGVPAPALAEARVRKVLKAHGVRFGRGFVAEVVTRYNYNLREIMNGIDNAVAIAGDEPLTADHLF